jgi:hypothetical protein
MPGQTRFALLPDHDGIALPTQPRIGPLLDLRRSDNLLRLMWIKRARARRQSLGQDLHRKKLGVDFRFEGAGGAGHALGRLVRLVGTKSHIPDIAVFHADITRVT